MLATAHIYIHIACTMYMSIYILFYCYVDTRQYRMMSAAFSADTFEILADILENYAEACNLDMYYMSTPSYV